MKDYKFYIFITITFFVGMGAILFAKYSFDKTFVVPTTQKDDITIISTEGIPVKIEIVYYGKSSNCFLKKEIQNYLTGLNEQEIYNQFEELCYYLRNNGIPIIQIKLYKNRAH